MSVRSGREYVDRLKSRPREVWLNGERIEDVTTHSAFKPAIEQIAHLYDLQCDPRYADALTYISPTTGNRVAASFLQPRTPADLKFRREAYRIYAEATFGLIGRSPDFQNTTVMAFAEAKDFFARGGARYAENVVSYYEYMRENDLFVTYALITPQNDRSKSSMEQAEDLHMRVVRETSDGVYISGARMLGTLGPIADEVLVYRLPGLKPGEEAYSVAFAVEVDAPGVKQICRQPFVSADDDSFDHPLATRFEEPDALFVFENAFVPWERVFVYNNVDLANAMFPDTNMRQHTAHQTAVRGLVKMQFLAGVGMAIAQAVKTDAFLHVQQMLGESLQYIEVVRSCVLAAEIEYETGIGGSIRPAFQPLEAVRTLMPTFYPRIAEIVTILGAGGLLMLPAGADFESAIGPLVEKYYAGAGSVSTLDRVRLYKLAWDLVGHGFGSRLTQYERYYAGDPVRTTAGVYASFDKTPMLDLVAAALLMQGDPKPRGGEMRNAPASV